ncbi:hypothetical protein [Tautonia sociabilis]|uniref:Uncharacterized protein n=1 Tax=Tautonia sociabilis TaxID=2080755 RepID=A0A432MGW9_9BACT|nr:hypothetical protein [Tautonia sociabilis]RUL86168.1 hypothetical protein TsocGM_16515 [Tautonia sociabilis]
MALDRTLVQIRERSYPDILDLALVVIRHRPGTIGATAAAGIAPWAALNAWLLREAGEIRALGHLWAIMLEAPIATAPLTIVLGGLMFGSKQRPSRVIATMLGRLMPMILYQFLLRSILIGTVALAWLVPTRMAFANEVILLERGRWWKVWSRSTDLTADRSGDLFGQWLAELVFGSSFVMAFWLATGQIAGVFEGELTWAQPEVDLVFNGWMILGIWIVVAFLSVVRFLTYIDQRIRLEGWEVELRLRAVGRTMREELEAW